MDILKSVLTKPTATFLCDVINNAVLRGVYRSIRAYCKTEGSIGSIQERFSPSNDDSLESECKVEYKSVQ